ncbi:MAG: DUF2281 domain-containing protein [Zoogloeaceae bacterium]|nr:DUF2281 domain-containing protein [Zoogloeaceae bacterium]MCK6385148.1 DUF2281 domain-containing protein [Rhodocyclaceae bacterium]
MSAQALIEKIRQLPPQRLAEVEDFVDFLRTREERAAAGARLGESLAKLDALNLPPLSDEEIAAEIQAAREQRAARRA